MFYRKKLTTYLFCILLHALLVAGCNAPFNFPGQGTPHPGNPISLLVSSAGATPTPTPFQPLGPTPTYLPTALPTQIANTNNLTSEPGGSQPAGLLDLPENQINILLLGSDQRVQNGGYRTDTIILVSINTTAKKVSMVSFPRDLYVYIPGWTQQRINTAMFHGDFDLMAKTLEYNFGIKPQYYALINFDAFRQIIDSLDGIDVEVAKPYTDQYWDKTFKTIPAGTVHMESAIALWYARARKASNDFDRARRQQEVLHAISKRLLTMNALENAKDLYDIYSANVITNITWSEITPLIPLMVHFRNPSLIQRYVIGPGEVYDWITPEGAMVLLPRQEKIIALLKQALGTE